MSQTLVSHNLAPLREQGLVTITAKGRSNVYSMFCEALAGPVKLLATLAALTPGRRRLLRGMVDSRVDLGPRSKV